MKKYLNKIDEFCFWIVAGFLGTFWLIIADKVNLFVNLLD